MAVVDLEQGSRSEGREVGGLRTVDLDQGSRSEGREAGGHRTVDLVPGSHSEGREVGGRRTSHSEHREAGDRHTEDDRAAELDVGCRICYGLESGCHRTDGADGVVEEVAGDARHVMRRAEKSRDQTKGLRRLVLAVAAWVQGIGVVQLLKYGGVDAVVPVVHLATRHRQKRGAFALEAETRRLGSSRRIPFD